MEERTLLKITIISLILLAISLMGNILFFIEYNNSPGPYVLNSGENVKIDIPKDMSYQDYSGAMMENADLSHANAYKALFRGTDLRNADLHGGTFSLADFSGADLTGADLVGATLDYADLSGAYLIDSNLLHADLRGADLSGADLTGALIENADLRWIKGNFTI